MAKTQDKSSFLENGMTLPGVTNEGKRKRKIRVASLIKMPEEMEDQESLQLVDFA